MFFFIRRMGAEMGMIGAKLRVLVAVVRSIWKKLAICP